MHTGEDVDDTHTPSPFGGGFLASARLSSPPSPLPLLSSGFLRHKRRGSSGGMELRSTAAAAAAVVAAAGVDGEGRGTGGQQRQRRRASMSSFDDITGGTGRFWHKSPGGRGSNSRRRRRRKEEENGEVEKGMKEGGGVRSGKPPLVGGYISTSGSGGDSGKGVESGAGDGTARAAAVTDEGGSARVSGPKHQHQHQQLGVRNARHACDVVSGETCVEGGKLEGGGGNGVGGAVRRDALGGGKKALDLPSPPDSVIGCALMIIFRVGNVAVQSILLCTAAVHTKYIFSQIVVLFVEATPSQHTRSAGVCVRTACVCVCVWLLCWLTTVTAVCVRTYMFQRAT